MLNRFQQPPRPVTPDRHWSPGPNYIRPDIQPKMEPSRSYERNQQRRAAFREKRKLQQDSKCYDRFYDGYDMNWNKEAGPWEDLAQEDIERIEAWRQEIAKHWTPLEKSKGYTEFGHLGATYTDQIPEGKIAWIDDKNLRRVCPFERPSTLDPRENILTPVVRVERYKNWIRQLCNRGGYCYLMLFKRKYRPYAFLLYGKNPRLGDLNLDEKEYRSKAFDELNVAINYEKKLIHVYRIKQVTYEEGFERYQNGNNRELIGNWWIPHYTVGATRTETMTERDYVRPQTHEIERVNRELEREQQRVPIAITTPSAPGGTAYVTPATPKKQRRATLVYDSSEEDERPPLHGSPTASTARYQGNLAAAATISGPPMADRTFMNRLMAGGMGSLQSHMARRHHEQLMEERNLYRNRVHKLEERERERKRDRKSVV